MPRAKAAPRPADDSDDAPLKRLGGGRWQTRDERFTIEPQSGTWVIVDAVQTDDFGMALVRGPYASLTDAKAAISVVRTSAPAESPLVGRIARRKSRPAAETVRAPDKGATAATGRDRSETRPAARGDTAPIPAFRASRAKSATRANRSEPDAPAEPAWLADLDAAGRGRARRLIARLEEAGVGDAVGVARRDLLGDVPAVAGMALGRRLAELGADATPAEVAALLADGRDDRFDVRWRLVDGAGRPIVLNMRQVRRG
ncbi:MAG: hypothetical protein M3Q66_00480 [Chloroflexota bacterium]|nr:hypothetical protein [Chloroflexota bacterium]